MTNNSDTPMMCKIKFGNFYLKINNNTGWSEKTYKFNEATDFLVHRIGNGEMRMVVASECYYKNYILSSDFKKGVGVWKSFGDGANIKYTGTDLICKGCCGGGRMDSNGYSLKYGISENRFFFYKETDYYQSAHRGDSLPESAQEAPITIITSTRPVKKKDEDINNIDNDKFNELYSDGKYAAYIAIDKYQEVDELKSCVSNAIKIEKTLTKQGFITLDYSTSNCILSNEDATKENIIGFLTRISDYLKTKPRSCFILYISGHGDNWIGHSAAFLCHDHINNDPLRNSLTYSELTNKISRNSSMHQLFILDSCYSGNLVDRESGGFGPRSGYWMNEYLEKPGIHGIGSVNKNARSIDDSIFIDCFINTLDIVFQNQNKIRLTDFVKKLTELSKKNISSQSRIPVFGRIHEIINYNNEQIPVNGELIFIKDPDTNRYKTSMAYKWKPLQRP